MAQNKIHLLAMAQSKIYLWTVAVTSSLTISITIFLKDCLCFLVRLPKMSQLSSCKSLKATAKWWFSKTDSSLYMSASSEPNEIEKNKKHMVYLGN